MTPSDPDLVEKTTAVPLYRTEWELRAPTAVHLSIVRGVTVERLGGVITERHFELWREYISQRDRKELSSFDVALVNRFYSREHVGRAERESRDLLLRIFACLRIIKPTSMPFYLVQFKRTADNQVDVFSFSHREPREINLPDAEALNMVLADDLALLGAIAPGFLRGLEPESNLDHFRRAVRLLDQGYADLVDPVLQIMVWTMGIECLLSRGGKDPMQGRELLEAISARVSFDTDIYERSAVRQHAEVQPILVGDVIGDVFELRNQLAHGRWFPKEWTERQVRNSVSGRPVVYAEVLREAASFVLRKALINFVTELQAGPTLPEQGTLK